MSSRHVRSTGLAKGGPKNPGANAKVLWHGQADAPSHPPIRGSLPPMQGTKSRQRGSSECWQLLPLPKAPWTASQPHSELGRSAGARGHTNPPRWRNGQEHWRPLDTLPSRFGTQGLSRHWLLKIKLCLTHKGLPVHCWAHVLRNGARFRQARQCLSPAPQVWGCSARHKAGSFLTEPLKPDVPGQPGSPGQAAGIQGESREGGVQRHMALGGHV